MTTPKRPWPAARRTWLLVLVALVAIAAVRVVAEQRKTAASSAASRAVGASFDDTREAVLPPAPAPPAVTGRLLFAADFDDTVLTGWRADRAGVWSVSQHALRGELPDGRQERSFLFAGSEAWSDYAVDVDVCQMRGVDKGVAVRVNGQQGIAVDLRGPGYQDLLLHRNEWPFGRAKVVNGNGVWHHLRVEARGSRYRVWVNGAQVLERTDKKRGLAKGGIALAAYTGGVGECTVYYDHVRVTALEP